MANNNKSQVGRTAAILTTGEVAGTALSLAQCRDAQLTVDLSFTIGSLTNVTVRFYASMDGTTYDPISSGVTVMSEVLTASTERCYVMPALSGWKFFRASMEGSGTATNSTANYTYRWLRRGSL
jgi:hypothetical protein